MARSHDSDSLNIVLAASEAVPYVKTGGLADVVGALPVEFAKLGHVVTLIVPRYRGFQTGGRLLRSLGSVRVQTSGGYVDAGLEEDLISVGGSGRPVRVVAVRYDPYFDRIGLYQGPEGDFKDNLNRFAFFSRAIIEVVALLGKRAGEPVPVLHLHDWQTALAAVYLKTTDRDRAILRDVRTLLTLHNVGYQGIFPGHQFSATGLPAELFTPAGLEFYGSVNLLKGGMVFADAVSTVSPTYAKEIMTPEGGFGLEGVLAHRRDGVIGITNGIDVESWNPETDRYLAANYSRADLSGKPRCKTALQRELGLPNRDAPLIGVIATVLIAVQNDLFDVGADLCRPVIDNPTDAPLRVTDAYVARLEAACDTFNSELDALRSFILPGGTVGAAHLHVDRLDLLENGRLLTGSDDARHGLPRPNASELLVAGAEFALDYLAGNTPAGDAVEEILAAAADAQAGKPLLDAGRGLRQVDVAALQALGLKSADVRVPRVRVVAAKPSDTVLDSIADRKSTRLNSSHVALSRMPSSA